tara:strand:+ start:496 stop:1128 length:633 start_codon:yes stop_codon:yes gene_type:complete
MAFEFNPDKVLAPVQRTNRRSQCHDLQGALTYLQERLAEMEADGKWTWITGDAKGAVVEVDLHGMPLYWKTFDTGGEEEIIIRNPDMTERTRRKAQYGGTMYSVDSMDEGVALLNTLAGGQNDQLNAILSNACEALKEVDEIELPAIEERAKILYEEAGLVKSMGAFGEPNEDNPNTGRMRISKAKTNKMNQYKQTARRQLGYARLRQKA